MRQGTGAGGIARPGKGGSEGQRKGARERWETGFTLIEVLVVLAILGALVSVVSVSVVGLLGRGEAEAYGADERSIQSAVVIFYADVHAYDRVNGWNEPGNTSEGHHFPTGSGADSALHRGAAAEVNGRAVWRVEGFAGSTAAEQAAEVEAAAIWMGLLVNEAGSGSPGPDVSPGDGNSPLPDEMALYLNEVPESCSHHNHSQGAGTYTWIVGAYGRVYGVFEEAGEWYIGYGGRYP